MGYICDRAHHLEIHADNERSDNNNNCVAAHQFGNEDICKQQRQNRKINQDHLATSSSSVSVSPHDNSIVAANDTDLDYNFYKYRKEKSPSTTFEQIVGYANHFLVTLGKLAPQYVEDVVSSRKSNTSTTTTSAVNKINVKSGSKSQSRKNNAINSRSPASTTRSTKNCSSGKSGSHASGDDGNGKHNHPSSHHAQHHHSSCGLVKHSLCLYAASSIIIALCYLTTPIVAYDQVHPIFAEGKSDKEILDQLLKKTRYDKRLLPPVDGTLTVNVSVLLLSLASPDESSLKYEVEFLLQQQWYDPRLRYANQSQYEYLNAIHHHEEIWLPDTYFIMHGDFKDPIIPMHFALRIYRNGTINYLMRRHLILSCQGRLNIFPFDDPLCSFALESISYEQSAITYVWKNDEDTLRKSPSLTTLNAYLIQNQTIACPIKASWRGNYSCLKVDLKFTRDRAFYFTTVFIPGIILVTSSFITFWLEWNAVPARVMIGVTTMLNFFTTSNGFRSTLPVVSNLTAMNVWDGVCMCFIYASLLEFVCVNYVGRKRPLHNVVYRPGENPVTQRLPAVLSRIGVILASPLEVIEQEFHAAISAEKPAAATGVVPIVGAGTSPPPPLSGSGAVLTSKSPSSVAAARSPVGGDDAEIGAAMPLMIDEQKPRARVAARTPVQTKIVGNVNDVEILETCFGPGEQTSKKRESGGPNEIVACTSCGGSASPCTHSANNGCATETCFVQVRKKEPPHPIRVAKTIDVIARITFPTAYAVFLIFFFIHYKGFS
ncbi:gamma-aminobutyric acid receptor subunit alpha-4 isoform X4 [Culicoides brevitarsis]|uniref:gamma-aminobutyric acid receptor subunit alpha-4 isoform X4 n=1 Tax=Culicoides brevitarsis TaxID=469753 RepID=UPI00307BFEF0